MWPRQQFEFLHLIITKFERARTRFQCCARKFGCVERSPGAMMRSIRLAQSLRTCRSAGACVAAPQPVLGGRQRQQDRRHPRSPFQRAAACASLAALSTVALAACDSDSAPQFSRGTIGASAVPPGHRRWVERSAQATLPAAPWDSNWDLRESGGTGGDASQGGRAASLGDSVKGGKSSRGSAQHQPTAVRHLILIRHGQYVTRDRRMVHGCDTEVRGV